MKLTAKQDAFARAYVANGGNATQAAKAAGYSERTARQAGTENLSKPYIVDFIDSLKKPVQESLGITAEWVRERLVIEAKLTKQQGGSQSGRVRALELLLKDLGGMFSDNQPTDDDDSARRNRTSLFKTMVHSTAGSDESPGTEATLPE